MISINKIGESITGSYGNETFGVPYTKERWEKMIELQGAADNAADMAELTKIFEAFKELTTVNAKETVETKCPYIHVNVVTGKYYLKTGTVVSSVELPTALVDRINESIDKGIDFMPLVKMWTRFLRNPKLRKAGDDLRKSFSQRVFNYINAKYVNDELRRKLIIEEGVSDEVARERATTYQVGITQEGLMKTFKVSNEITHKWILDEDGNPKKTDMYPSTKEIDPVTGLVTYKDGEKPAVVEERIFQPAVMGTSGDKFYCGSTLGHVIRVGQVHKLESWDQINTNDNQSCVPGLHVGGLDYIRGYQGSGTVTHNVFVDPMHIGAVPDDHTGAIRCVQYFVHSSFAGVNGSIYHSSTYAKMTDEEWDAMRAEAIKSFGEYKESQEKLVTAETNEINAL